jgi:hypothetical protein
MPPVDRETLPTRLVRCRPHAGSEYSDDEIEFRDGVECLVIGMLWEAFSWRGNLALSKRRAREGKELRQGARFVFMRFL